MYGIFTYIWLKFMVNVGKYTIVPWSIWVWKTQPFEDLYIFYQQKIVIFHPLFHETGIFTYYIEITLPETNIAPENGFPQKESSLPTAIFQGRAVSFRECR